MELSLGLLNSVERILFSFNGATTVTLGDVALIVKVGPITQQVLFSIVKDFGVLQCDNGASLAALDEGCPFDLSPNGKLFD